MRLKRTVFLLGEPSLGFVLLSSPVILGLSHSVSKSVLVLCPVLVNISSTVKVKLSVVKELSSLSYVLLVVVSLLLVISVTDSFVLCLGKSSRNVGIFCKTSSFNLFN